jgi:hypothetical protein
MTMAGDRRADGWKQIAMDTSESVAVTALTQPQPLTVTSNPPSKPLLDYFEHGLVPWSSDPDHGLLSVLSVRTDIVHEGCAPPHKIPQPVCADFGN